MYGQPRPLLQGRQLEHRDWLSCKQVRTPVADAKFTPPTLTELLPLFYDGPMPNGPPSELEGGPTTRLCFATSLFIRLDAT